MSDEPARIQWVYERRGDMTVEKMQAQVEALSLNDGDLLIVRGVMPSELVRHIAGVIRQVTDAMDKRVVVLFMSEGQRIETLDAATARRVLEAIVHNEQSN